MSDQGATSSDRKLTCKGCGKTWEYEPLVGVPIGQWQANLERQACPECGTLYTLTSLWDPKRWRPEWRAAGMVEGDETP